MVSCQFLEIHTLKTFSLKKYYLCLAQKGDFLYAPHSNGFSDFSLIFLGSITGINASLVWLSVLTLFFVPLNHKPRG